MSNIRGIRAGKAFVELFADDSKLVRGLRSAQQKLSAFGSSVQGLGAKVFATGAAIATPLVATTKAFTDYGAAANKLSVQTGNSVESITRLHHAANQVGVDTDDLSGSIEELQIRLGEAIQDGTGPLGESFKKLGLDAEAVASMPLEKRFGVIADALSNLANESDRQFLADEIFGGDAFKILPLLAQGSEGIRNLAKESDRLGLTLDKGQAEAAAKAAKEWRTLTATFRGAVMQIGSALLPVLTSVIQSITSGAEVVRQFVSENRNLVLIIAGVAAGLVAGGAALSVFGVLISSVASGIGIIAGIITTVMSPVGLLVGAIVGLGLKFLDLGEIGGAVFDWLKGKFGTLKDDAIASFGAIGNALASGDIASAMRVLWALLKMEWQRGVAFLSDKWAGFKASFLDLWNDAVFKMSSLMIDGMSGILNAWQKVMSGFKSGWVKTQNFLSEGILTVMSKFDDSIDLEDAKKTLNEDNQRRLKAIEQQRDNAIAANEQSRQGSQNELTAIAEEEQRKRNQAYQQQLGAGEAELQKARAEWEAAVKAANQAKKTVASDDGLPDFDSLKSKMQRASSAVQDASEKTSTTGTFNAAAVRGFAASSAADRTARAAEMTADNTRKLLNAVKESDGIDFV